MNNQGLFKLITDLPDTAVMDRLGLTKNALFYLYYDAERVKCTDFQFGRQLSTILHIAVLDLAKEKK